MNKEIEEIFVKNFIMKDKQERVLYELGSVKKRGHIIQQLISFLDSKYEVFCDKKVSDEIMLSAVQKYFDTNRLCYVIGDCVDDGKRLKFTDAFNRMMSDGGQYFILCDDGKTVVIKEEAYSSACKIILHKDCV